MENLIFAASFKQFLYKYEEDSKICKILYTYLEGSKWFKEKRYFRSHKNVLTDNFCNYLNFRKNGYIGYLPAGKECLYNDNNEWKKDNRQEGKPAKVIRKIFTERAAKLLFCDTDFEIFANLSKKEFNGEGYTLEVLSRHHIKDIYDANICEGNGSLNGSCMNGDTGYLDIYENCSKLQIMVLWNRAKELCGRALLWEFRTGEFFMDRIYTVKDFEFEYFLDYAKQNKYWYKLHYKSYDNKTLWINPNSDEVEEMKVTIITDCDLDEFPYIDTFSYGEGDSLNNFGNGHYIYNNTNGTRDGEDNEDIVYCEIYGESYHIDELIYIEHDYCERCYRNEHIRDCDAIEVYVSYNRSEIFHYEDNNVVRLKGQYYYIHHEDIVNIDHEYYHIDDCVYSEYMSEYILVSDAIEIDNDWYIKDDCILFEGEYYPPNSDEVVYCVTTHKYEHVSNCVLSFPCANYYLKTDEKLAELKGRFYIKYDTIYKNAKKQFRKDRRNKLGRKNRNKKVNQIKN